MSLLRAFLVAFATSQPDFIIGLMFVVNGATYALFAPIWGYVCDKKLAPIIVTAIGSVLMFVSFLFIGPAPFFPFHTVSLCKTCLALIDDILLLFLDIGIVHCYAGDSR